jgi:tetratricopeptide (TPR) repeat protein
MIRNRIALAIPFAAAIALCSCGNSSPPAPQGGGGGEGGPAKPQGPTLGKKLPEYKPSGMKDDWKKCVELESAVKSSKKLDEQAAAKKALADYIAEFPARWEGKEVPAPEACYYAVMLQKCKLYPQAVIQAERYIEVAPEDSANYLNCHTTKISSMAQAGDFEGAEAELKKATETVYKGREGERRVLAETIANSMLKGGRVDLASEHFREQAESQSDMESAIQAIDCYLRMGRNDDAVRLSKRMTDLIKEGKNVERAKWMVQQLDLIGRPAPGFSGAKWWKGTGGPVSDADLKGKVTVVFTWNMKSAWNQFFFDRLAQLIKDLADKPFQVIGISRLAHYDPVTGGTKADMTEDEELTRYDMWAQQYPVTYPLAVDGFEKEDLLGPWVGHVVPYYVVVGKDGNIFYVRTGKNEEHFAALKEMIEKALAK